MVGIPIVPSDSLSLSLSLAILAFVIVKDGITDSDQQIFDGLKEMVKKTVGGFATPHQFLVSIALNFFT